jgi:hypothetical protein
MHAPESSKWGVTTVCQRGDIDPTEGLP